MAKTVSFTDNDEKLIQEIMRYQKNNGLPSFVAAVRKLCQDALQKSIQIKIEQK